MKDETSSLCVVDASYVLAYLIPDHQHQQVDLMMQQHADGDMDLIAPPILSYDLCNGLLAGARAGQIDDKQASLLLKRFIALEIGTASVKARQAYLLARDHQLSFYEAAYLQLSRQNGAQLLTMNSRLARLASPEWPITNFQLSNKFKCHNH